MDKLKLLSDIFDKKTVDVIVKILSKEDIFYLRDISRESGVSLATTYRIAQKLVKIGLVKKDSLDKFTYYKIQKNSPVHDELAALFIGKKTDIYNTSCFTPKMRLLCPSLRKKNLTRLMRCGIN